MKNNISLALAALVALVSCGPTAELSSSSQQFEDGIYYTHKTLTKAEAAAASAEVDQLVSRTRTSELFLTDGINDTLVIPDFSTARITYNPEGTTVVNIYNGSNYDLNWYDPYWYSSYTYRDWYWDSWHWSSWYRDPWYYGGWGLHRPYYSYWDRWYWNSWYWDSWYWDPWYHDPWYYRSYYHYSWYDPWYYGGYHGYHGYHGWHGRYGHSFYGGFGRYGRTPRENIAPNRRGDRMGVISSSGPRGG